MSDEIFGPLLAFSDVESGLILHMKDWLDGYLSARERMKGITPGTIHRPRTWITKQTFDILPGEESTPAIIVVAGGSNSVEWRASDDRRLDVYFLMGVAVICRGPESAQTRALAGHYQAAVLSMLLQKKKFKIGTTILDSVETDVNAIVQDFEGLDVDDIPEELDRTTCAVRMKMTIKVKDFASTGGGPLTIPPAPHDPAPPLGEVENHDEEVTNLPDPDEP